MDTLIHNVTLGIVCAPLLGAIIAGLFGKIIGRKGAHSATILLMMVSFGLAIYLAKLVILSGNSYNANLYTWGASGNYSFHVGFLVDKLTSMMILTVTFVSLLVHIYSIGYMADDPGYQRFFSYISLFTFAMLMLVTANNFLQLFFGWEGVGLVSYLLIGFWFHRESAIQGSLKAFLVNRVGDFGFVIGIAAILTYFGSLDYVQVFAQVPAIADSHTSITLFSGVQWSVITMICILLFIGAMAKSAQMPLHVWLPESMEGPTPISALIHAATMVTAGIFMVCRMSPLFQHSETAQTVVLVIAATGALFTGLIAIVQNDIKRVVAYSTLSQLGYMMAAAGASAYAAGIFHLVTHASFKALLFLGAGSVIIAMHHDQDMRNMGGLRKYMPITYLTFLIGTLSLSAIPPFSGFYSKDAIIESIHATTIAGHGYAYICVLLGSFVTAFYSFRAFFMTFHGKERMDDHTRHHLKESPWVVWLPLVILSIPSVVQGYFMIEPILFQPNGLLTGSLEVLPQYNVLQPLAEEFHGAGNMMMEAFTTAPFWLAIFGVFTAWFFYVAKPALPAQMAKRFSLIYNILLNKYGFDSFNQVVFVDGTVKTAKTLYRGDARIIDDFIVNGSGRAITWLSSVTRRIQTGYIYHYVFIMLLGLMGLLVWWVL